MRSSVAVLAAVVFAAACAEVGPAISAQQQTTGVTIRFECDPAIAGESNVVRIAVSDAQGRPVTGARVELRPSMADMEMGAGTLVTTPRENGRYEIDGVRFSMSGPWQIAVDVREHDGTAHRATFPIVVKD